MASDRRTPAPKAPKAPKAPAASKALKTPNASSASAAPTGGAAPAAPSACPAQMAAAVPPWTASCPKSTAAGSRSSARSARTVEVTAHVHADGHDVLAVRLRHRPADEPSRSWHELAMAPLGNDEWRASFAVAELGAHEYTVEAWVDHFLSWRRELAIKAKAGVDISTELREGGDLVAAAAARCARTDRAPRTNRPRRPPRPTSLATTGCAWRRPRPCSPATPTPTCASAQRSTSGCSN